MVYNRWFRIAGLLKQSLLDKILKKNYNLTSTLNVIKIQKLCNTSIPSHGDYIRFAEMIKESIKAAQTEVIGSVTDFQGVSETTEVGSTLKLYLVLEGKKPKKSKVKRKINTLKK